MKKILALLLALVSPALGQSVQQSGFITPGNVAKWVTNGVIADGGTPGTGASLLGSFVINDMLCANANGTAPAVIDCGFSVTGTNNWVGLQNLNGGATAPTRSPGDSTTNVATTAFATGSLVNFLGTANTWTATQQFGPLPWVQALNYASGSTGTNVLSVRGSIASPVTDNIPTAIFQGVSNIASGTSQTLYGSVVKRGTAANTDYRAVWGECNDPVGGAGSSIACGRFSGALTGGTGGNGTGVTAAFVCQVSYTFCGGVEGQVFNQFADATTTFSISSFETAFLASNPSTKTSFAGFMTNPHWTIPFINGVYIAAGTVQDSGFRVDASVVNGIDLSRGTYSGTQVKWTNGSIDPAGNVISGAGVSAGGTNGIFWSGRSIMQSPVDGVIEFSNQAITGFTSLKLGGATSSFPSIKRNSTALNFRLADDSADAPITAGATTLSGQLVSTAGLPTIASGACGTTTNGAVVAGSTNQSGNITIGAAATTTCTISWSTTLSVAPNACVFFPANATAAATGTTVARTGAPSTTQVVLTGGALANANYSYICL